jgi:hypothetical protein
MSMKAIFTELSGDVVKLSPDYERDVLEHPLLGHYPTLTVLLATLSKRTKKNRAERSAIVCALVDLHQASQHEPSKPKLWSTILLHAFAPILARIRAKLHGGQADTRDSFVLASFVETIGRIRTARDPARIYMYIRQETRRGAVLLNKQESRWQPFGFGVEADLEPDPSTLAEPQLRGVWLRGKLRDEWEAELVGTLVDRGALFKLVVTRHPDLPPDEQARVLSRLHKQRERLVKRLRTQLRSESA